MECVVYLEGCNASSSITLAAIDSRINIGVKSVEKEKVAAAAVAAVVVVPLETTLSVFGRLALYYLSEQ